MTTPTTQPTNPRWMAQHQQPTSSVALHPKQQNELNDTIRYTRVCSALFATGSFLLPICMFFIKAVTLCPNFEI